MFNSATPWTATRQASLFHHLPEFCSNSYPFSQWCHLIISASVAPLSSYPQSFPASRFFPMSRLLASDGQTVEASASAPVLLMNIQDWLPLGWTVLISLQSKKLSRVFSSTTVQKHQFFWHSAFFMIQLSHPYISTGKTIVSTICQPLLAKWCLYYLIHCLGLS